jgi:hypothetical protein
VDKEGRFAISTYLSGDGAPAGEYAITLEWLTYKPFGNQWGGPDKLKGRYSKVADSDLRITVEQQPQQNLRYTLTLK